MTDWIVALEQTRPYELVVLEVMSEQSDAIAWASTWAGVRPTTRMGKKRWRLIGDDEGTRHLIIFGRRR